MADLKKFLAQAEEDEGVAALRAEADAKLEVAGTAQEAFATVEKQLDSVCSPTELAKVRERIERAHGSALLARNQHARATKAADDAALEVAKQLKGENDAKIAIAQLEHQRAALRRLVAGERAASAELGCKQATLSAQTLGADEPIPRKWMVEEKLAERRRLILDHNVAPYTAADFVRTMKDAFPDAAEVLRGLDEE